MATPSKNEPFGDQSFLTLSEQGRDSGVPNATPAERVLMVWLLTLTAWAFKEPNVAQPRLQRNVVRTYRGPC